MGGCLKYSIQCSKCRSEIELREWVWKHTECNGTLNIEFKGLENIRFSNILRKEYNDIRRYIELLPVKQEYVPKIPVGGTPLAKRYLGANVYFKMDYLNPSGSFKDRGAYVTLAKVKELGCQEIIEDSSGNAGIAFSLLARTADIKANIYIPKKAPEGKKRFLKLLGANVVKVEGSREDVNKEALKAERKGKGVYVGHWWNPFFIEGLKTIAYELWEQLGEKIDYIFTPVGSGGLFLGIFKGFLELKNMGTIPTIPKLVAVQAQGYCSLCEKLGLSYETKERSKLADGIMILKPPRLSEIINAIRKTEGFCVVVSDKEIVLALKELINMGFIVEPTSATAYAAFKKSFSENLVGESSNVVIVLTGSGLKVLDKLNSVIFCSNL
ncbi:MAG: threonine synthase [Thermoprotei archaeon]|nr:MAG: threonine synthase [Thermoprotei archaeon]